MITNNSSIILMMRIMYLIFGFLILVLSQAQAATLSDLAESPYQTSVENLVKKGIIKGYPDGTFRPEKAINRAEFLKILLETKLRNQVSVYRAGENTCFADLPSSDLWYKVYACVGKDRHIIQGYPDGTFRAADSVNKAQAAKILYNLYFSPLSVETKPWYQGYYHQLKLKDIFLTIFNGSPDEPLTRGEMAFAIDQFQVYPSHQLSPPSVNPASISPVVTSSEVPTPTTPDPVPPAAVTPTAPPSTSTAVSPLSVVTTRHPGQEVAGGYISSYSQWQATRYPASVSNYQGENETTKLLASQVLESVNAARIAAGKKAMRLNHELQAVAQNFAAHLVINAIYSHSDKLGRDPFDRAKLAGIDGFVAESIVWRNRDPVKAIDWWKKSQIHWNNVSNSRFVSAGVGIAKEPSGGYIVVLFQGE